MSKTTVKFSIKTINKAYELYASVEQNFKEKIIQTRSTYFAMLNQKKDEIVTQNTKSEIAQCQSNIIERDRKIEEIRQELMKPVEVIVKVVIKIKWRRNKFSP